MRKHTYNKSPYWSLNTTFDAFYKSGLKVHQILPLVTIRETYLQVSSMAEHDARLDLYRRRRRGL